MRGNPAHEVVIERLWSGEAAEAAERTVVRIAHDPDRLVVEVDAQFHADPPPPVLPGLAPRLWEHEVVEVFLLARPERYLEIELGPYGHHLALEFDGRRRVTRSGVPVDFSAAIDGERWWGCARLDAALVPRGVDRFNVYAIHGEGAERRYLALFPVPGDEPDFHRLEHFGPWPPT